MPGIVDHLTPPGAALPVRRARVQEPAPEPGALTPYAEWWASIGVACALDWGAVQFLKALVAYQLKSLTERRRLLRYPGLQTGFDFSQANGW